MIEVQIRLATGKEISLFFRGDREVGTDTSVKAARFLKYLSELYLGAKIMVTQRLPEEAMQERAEIAQENIMWLPPFNLMRVLSAAEQGIKIFHNGQEVTLQEIDEIALAGGIQTVQKTWRGLEITQAYLQ